MFGSLMLMAAQPNPALFEIPRPFWGEYNEKIEDCGTGNNDSRLRISWDRIRFYETTGELQELLRLPDGSLLVVTKHVGEGQTWMNVYKLSLSSNGAILTITHPQTQEIEQFSSDRFRCPVKMQ